MDQTSRLALDRPAADGSDPPIDYRLAIVDHANKLDVAAVAYHGAAAGIPAAGLVDRYYFEDDTGVLNRDNGAAWSTIGTRFHNADVLQWGSDTNLYRSAANLLKTDDAFAAAGGYSLGTPLGGSVPAYQSQQVAAQKVLRNKLLAADANDAFQILGDGKHWWGAGGASAVDTNLYRSAAGVLKTDGDFRVGGGLAAGGSAPSVAVPMLNTQSWTDDTNAARQGFFNNITYHPVTAGLANSIHGLQAQLTVDDDAATADITGPLIALGGNFIAGNNAGAPRALSDVTAVRGRLTSVSGAGVGTINDARCFYAVTTLGSSGTWANRYGLHIAEAATSGAVLTNQYGVYVDALASGATLNQAFRSNQTVARVVLENRKLASDANPTYQMLGDGKHWWGAGGATALDTNLYRSAADTLKTDDNLIVDLSLRVNGNLGVFNTAPIGQYAAPTQARIGGVPGALAAGSTLNDVIAWCSRVANALQGYGLLGTGGVWSS